MKFKQLTKEESEKLGKALKRNAEEGTPLVMDPLTTGWTSDQYDTDEAVLNAIASVPCHY